jgi:predicted nucleic acid-binding protein
LRVFFDADVLIAGSASTTGASCALLHLAEIGIIEGVTSAQATQEAEDNIRQKLPAAINKFRAFLSSAVHTVVVPSPADIQSAEGQAAPEDVPILAAALASGSRYLVTFNVRDYFFTGKALRVVQPEWLVKHIRRSVARRT